MLEKANLIFEGNTKTPLNVACDGFSLSELKQAILKLKNGKAAGLDKISNEMPSRQTHNKLLSYHTTPGKMNALPMMRQT